MLKILFIDNDFAEINRITDIINLLSPNRFVIEKAADWENAMLKTQNLRPDIVVMSLMSDYEKGFTYAKIYRVLNRNCRFIAYGDKNYELLRMALESGFMQYLTMPLKEMDLLRSLDKAEKDITEEKEQESYITNLEKKQGSYLWSSKSSLFRWLIYADHIDEAKLSERVNKCGLKIEGRFCCICMRIQSIDANKAYGYEDIFYSIEDYFDKDDITPICIWHIDKNSLLLIGNNDAEVNYREKQEALTERLEKDYAVKVFSGIGSEVRNIRFVGCSYQEAQEALEYQFFDKAPITTYEQVKLFKRNLSENEMNCEKKLLENIHNVSDDDLNDLVKKQMRYFVNNSGGDKNNVFLDCYELYNKCRNQLEEDGFKEAKKNIYKEIIRRNTVFDLTLWMQSVMHRFCEIQKELISEQDNDIVAKSKKYLEKHFNEDISLEFLAKKFYVSPTYLSYLFKSREKIGYHEYLLGIRMREALRLVRIKKYSINEISRKVGFTNSRYFSEVFKKYYGTLPSQSYTIAEDNKPISIGA